MERGKREAPRATRKRRRSAGRLRRVLLSLALCCAAAFVVYQVWHNVSKPKQTEREKVVETEEEKKPVDTEPVESNPRRKDCYTFLLAASDQSSGNADVIIAVTYDIAAQKVGAVSIPRDTLVDPDHLANYPKINSSYTAGVDRLEAVVSDMLGIPFDYYVTVDVQGFVELVDAVDGVEFDVPAHMRYSDPKQDLYISFEPGVQHLDGKEALKVCRIRQNDDGTLLYGDYDIGRTRTQQQMLLTIAKKVLANPQKVADYLKIFREYVDTNLSVSEMLWFVEPVLKLDLQNVETATFSGDGATTYRGITWCYELDPAAALETVNAYLNPYEKPMTAEDLNIFQAP